MGTILVRGGLADALARLGPSERVFDPGLSDTEADAERVQLEMLRRATPARRLEMALSLSQTVMDLARESLRRRHPGLGDDALRRRFVELCYGPDVAHVLDEAEATQP